MWVILIHEIMRRNNGKKIGWGWCENSIRRGIRLGAASPHFESSARGNHAEELTYNIIWGIQPPNWKRCCTKIFTFHLKKFVGRVSRTSGAGAIVCKCAGNGEGQLRKGKSEKRRKLRGKRMEKERDASFVSEAHESRQNENGNWHKERKRSKQRVVEAHSVFLTAKGIFVVEWMQRNTHSLLIHSWLQTIFAIHSRDRRQRNFTEKFNIPRRYEMK